jgi:cystathionine gamma-lyase
MKNLEESKFATRSIHAGQEPAPVNNAIMTPIYQTSTFVQSSPGEYFDGYDYSRSKNPTRTALEENLASLEGGERGMAFSSGCAATSAVIQSLQPGDRVISADDVYGGTYRLFENVFKPFGIHFDFVDLCDPKALTEAICKETKLIWIESPTNPLLKVIDIEAVSTIARKRGIKTVVDNTFASPYLQNPLSLGADLVVHSTTKYIGGHSDVIGGAVITSDTEWADRISYLQNAIGSVPAPMDCFLLLRSTKTLALRMERHSENASYLAQWLSEQPGVSSVVYPGLESHPQYEVARKQMKAGGGIITIELDGGLNASRTFLESVELFSLAESLGGVESLIEHPGIMTHASIPLENRLKLGITDGLVRLSVGIEDRDDLRSDLAQALDKTKASLSR